MHGKETFYTKKALDEFKKKLRQKNIKYSSRKRKGNYDIQFWKKI